MLPSAFAKAPDYLTALAQTKPAEHLVDSEFRPIYRLRLWSGVLQSFALKTEFTRA
jgi:hypothetical protein